jgi:hypothetical protein
MDDTQSENDNNHVPPQRMCRCGKPADAMCRLAILTGSDKAPIIFTNDPVENRRRFLSAPYIPTEHGFV